MFRVGLILILMNLLSGCAAVLLGGGAAGGYYVGTDERTIGEITDDTTIVTKIKSKYIKEQTIHAFDINVDSYQGHVTLRGTVESDYAKKRAIQLAKETNGVKDVNAKLIIAAKP